MSPVSQDQSPEFRKLLALPGCADPPATFPAEGGIARDGIRSLFFEGLSCRGQPTRVFAVLGIPEAGNEKLPAVVLVHGGGGTAFREWVARWKARGYVALSIAVEGQTDVPAEGNTDCPWLRHAHAGPSRQGIYRDSARPLGDQWIYHAVADTILAHSLLRSFPEVDGDRIGLMGISWGAVIGTTVIGIDPRFAFGILAYGCGFLVANLNEYGRALRENGLYHELWEPSLRLKQASLPTLWLSWTGDAHFSLTSQAASYQSIQGEHMVSLVPFLGHGHGFAWEVDDSYAFADGVFKHGKPWCRQVAIKGEERRTAQVVFSVFRAIDSASLIFTRDTGFTGDRGWQEAPASIHASGNRLEVSAQIPGGSTAWFLLLRSGSLYACSDFQSLEAE